MGERRHHEQVADVKTRRSGVEPDIARDLSSIERVAHAFGFVVHQPTPRKLAMQVHQPLLYNPPMGLTRRAALKGLVATTVGATTGAAVYGVSYERHHLGVTEADLQVSG